MLQDEHGVGCLQCDHLAGLSLLRDALQVALPLRTMGRLGAGPDGLLPALWRHLDHPGLRRCDQAVQEADVVAEIEHRAARGALTSDVPTHLLDVADRLIQLRAWPRNTFQSITFALQSPEIDNADRDALLNIFMGQPVRITNLPLNILGGEFTGFIEGWTFNASVSDSLMLMGG